MATNKNLPYMKKKGDWVEGSTMPVVFATHGGGPLPVLGDSNHTELTAWMKQVGESLPRPKSILVISAHWEESTPTVLTTVNAPLLFDYYNFPPETYKYTYPAPDAPELAAAVRRRLERAGIPCGEDGARGRDHGVFVPLMLMYPAADIPVTQLSLVGTLDPALHLAVGRALSGLRSEGVLILGSGASWHNLAEIRGTEETVRSSLEFDSFLVEACSAVGARREERLGAWETAPGARASHPREEHLLPLLVTAAAAGEDPGRQVFSGFLFGKKHSCFQFGA